MISLREGEKIYLIKRRHPFILLRNLFPLCLIFLATILVMVIFLFLPLPDWPNFLAKFILSLSEVNLRYLLLFFLSLFLLILWVIIFLTFTAYYLDYWIVTNQRTIHTELRGLFSISSSSVFHDRIQDITLDIHGFFPTIFRFGNLHIQTAGEFREFIFKEIPEPSKTKDVIFQAQKEFLRQMKKDGLL